MKKYNRHIQTATFILLAGASFGLSAHMYLTLGPVYYWLQDGQQFAISCTAALGLCASAFAIARWSL